MRGEADGEIVEGRAPARRGHDAQRHGDGEREDEGADGEQHRGGQALEHEAHGGLLVLERGPEVAPHHPRDESSVLHVEWLIQAQRPA